MTSYGRRTPGGLSSVTTIILAFAGVLSGAAPSIAEHTVP